MLYGVSGSSGCGKSTVCALVADALDMTFLRTSITEVAKRHGVNAVGNLSLSERITLQEYLLADHIERIRSTPTPVILDRTPIDFIAYMLCEVGMHSHEGLDEVNMKRVAQYVEDCLQVAAKSYDYIFHLGPLPFYEQASTRPNWNPAYQRHCDLVMRGALNQLHGCVNHAVINETDLDTRQTFIHDTIVARLNSHETFRNESRHVN